MLATRRLALEHFCNEFMLVHDNRFLL